MNPVTIVKLGGSAITKKSKQCTPDLATLQTAVDQLADYHNPLIVLHGAGSFGHQTVKRARLHKGLRRQSQLSAISQTELCLDQLTRIIEVSFLRRRIPFVPFNPMSFLTMRKGRVRDIFSTPLRQAINSGLTPIIHGDLAFDSKLGLSVVSADQLASKLGVEFKESRVLLGCDVDGVFQRSPKHTSNARVIKIVDKTNASEVLRTLRARASGDTTGGMYGKVIEALTLAKKGHICFIFNLRKRGMLTQALKGDFSSGTLFPQWPN